MIYLGCRRPCTTVELMGNARSSPRSPLPFAALLQFSTRQTHNWALFTNLGPPRDSIGFYTEQDRANTSNHLNTRARACEYIYIYTFIHICICTYAHKIVNLIIDKISINYVQQYLYFHKSKL